MTVVEPTAVVRDVVPLLFVDDIQRCAAFYVETLGFEMQAKWEPKGVLAWCKLRRDAAAVMLQQARDEDAPASERGRGVAFYFNCSDVDAMYAEILARGLAVGPPKVAFYGEKQLSLQDPGGYSLCFQSPATPT